jgi:hypothetical protein
VCAKRRDCRKLIQISNSNDRIINTAAIDGTKRHSVFWPIYNHEVLGDDDIQLPGKIWISHQGYAMMRQPGIDVAVHRHIMGLKAGDGKQVDHINRDKLDNRRCNLRVVKPQQNLVNKSKRKNTATKYIGVTMTAQGKFCSRIGHEKKIYRLGNYCTAIEAAEAYDKACKHFRGNFAVCNLL